MITKIVLSDESIFALNCPLPFGGNARNRARITDITESPQGDILKVKCSDGSAVWVYPSTICYVVVNSKEQPTSTAAKPTSKPRAKPKVTKPVSAQTLTPPRPGPQRVT